MPLLLLIFLVAQKWSAIRSALLDLCKLGKTEYSLKGTVYVNKSDGSQHGNVPHSLVGLLYHIKVANLAIPKGRQIHLEGISRLEDFKDCIVPAEGRFIALTTDIQLSVDIDNRHSSTHEGSGEFQKAIGLEETHIVIHLTSWKPLTHILEVLAACEATYTRHIQQKTEQPVIMKPVRTTDKHAFLPLSCEKIPYISNKTFDTLFFDGKRELLARLDEFKAGTSPLVERMGMPQTLGLLFWGEPGTGKTSVIKAIANYMNRSLVQIPMNKIKTRKDLEDIMQGDWMTYSVPHNKRIYVLEEIDCSGWDEIVRDRRLPPLSTKEKEVVVLEEGGGKRALKAAAEEAEKLTLGALLEILDGIVETPGRMVIMTTNHREILDPALTRPGRIDMEIEFKKLRRTHIHQIYERLFGTRLGAAKLQQIPDYAITQAELGQILHRHSRDPEGFVAALAAYRSI